MDALRGAPAHDVIARVWVPELLAPQRCHALQDTRIDGGRGLIVRVYRRHTLHRARPKGAPSRGSLVGAPKLICYLYDMGAVC